MWPRIQKPLRKFGLVLLVLMAIPLRSAAKPVDDIPGGALEIKVETAKTRPSAGTSLDVLVRVKNVSKQALFVDTIRSTLVFPSELSTDPTAIGKTFVYFGEERDSTDRALDFYRLNPGDEIPLFATTSKASGAETPPTSLVSRLISHGIQLTETVLGDLRFLSFSPAQHKLSAVIFYTARPGEPGSTRIRTELLEMPVGAPQTVILLGAALGGLLAYLLILRPSPKEVPIHLLKEGYALFWTALFSITVTILLSRVAETQFFIRVTVNDIWGAIAMGFIASYGGKALLEKLLPSSKKTDDHKPGTIVTDHNERDRAPADAQTRTAASEHPSPGGVS